MAAWRKKWDTVIPADLKRLFVSGTYTLCPAGHERVNAVCFEARTEFLFIMQMNLRLYGVYIVMMPHLFGLIGLGALMRMLVAD